MFSLHRLPSNSKLSRTKMIKPVVRENFRFLFKLTFIYFIIQISIRSILILKSPPAFFEILDVFMDGLLWDAYAWLITSVPLLLMAIFIPVKNLASFNHSRLNQFVTCLFTFIFISIGFCELIFWNEFTSRFNFIAVDYLIYTNEVLGNLKESFPLGWIFLSILILAVIITYLSSKISFAHTETPPLKKRTSLTLFGFVFPAVFIISIGPWLENHEEDFHDDQLSRNGMVEFARAFRSNKIDYKSFYPTLPYDQVEIFFQNKSSTLEPLSYSIEKSRPNVVIILVESLGAKFIGSLKGQSNTTPYLNKLSDQSIFFENLYATGTRTVRGLEAVNLSIPPTPGYAVVKRPLHKNLYSLGNTFGANGYDPIFIYGGNGFFDNMNSFFSGNGFTVIDKGDFKKSEITFSNVWGACDEDLFNKAHQEILKRPTSSNPFLMFLLTTSNHRPFTYPAGKIDIPSGESRAGAVKYTDYAIGTFLEKAQKEPWAKNTVFVIMADHSTEGRGQFNLEMSDFHIPLWIYAPHLLKPQRISRLGSQIDLLPSLIHLLNLKDDSPFYGKSLFDTNWKEERAFIGNYQYVGYYRNNTLTTLGPNQSIRNFSYDPITKVQKAQEKSLYINEAISYYQSASHKLDNGEYKVKE